MCDEMKVKGKGFKCGCAGAVVTLLLCATAFCQDQVEVKNNGAQVVLRNERVTVALSKPDKGGIVSLTDNATGQEFIAQQKEPCLFRLAFTKKGDVSGATQAFSSRDAQEVKYSVSTSGKETVATLEFKAIGGKRIDATCKVSVSEGDPLVRWRISINGQEPLVLEEVQFPVVVLRDRLGDSGDVASAVFGSTTGGIFRPGKWRSGWSLGGGGRKQPGSLAAQFACYYDATAGFYTATYDGKGYPKQFDIRRLEDGVGFDWKHLCFHEASKPFHLDYDAVCTTFRSKERGIPTDWRDAADIYKQWALQQSWCRRTIVERKDIPKWLKSGVGIMAWDMNGMKSYAPVVQWLDRYWNKHFAPASPVIVPWGWEKVGEWIAPKYFPVRPSDEEFEKAVVEIGKRGGHFFLWPSTYQWTLTYTKRPDGTFEWDDRADFERVGRPHAILRRDGSVFTDAYPWLNGGESAALCRGDAWSREFLNETTAQILKRGADAVQYDQQVGGGWPAWGETTCFSRDHGHPPGFGLWDTQAVHQQMSAMRERCARIGREVAFSIEEPQELFIQEFSLFDYRHSRLLDVRWGQWASADYASVFAYLYHEFASLFSTGICHLMNDPVRAALCMVDGQIPFWDYQFAKCPEPAPSNGGFEMWQTEVFLPGWSCLRGTISRDDREKHSGQFSLRLQGQDESAATQVKQLIPVDGKALAVGKTYRVRLWLKCSGVQQGSAVNIATYDKEIDTDWRQWKSTGQWPIEMPQETGWAEKSITFAIPQGSRGVDLCFNLRGKGRVWLDDVVMEEIGKDGGAREVVVPESPATTVLRQWVRLMAGEGRAYLLLGRMLHPPQLVTDRVKHTFFNDGVTPGKRFEFERELPAILHNAFRAPDGSEAVIAVNITDQLQTGKLRWAGKEIELNLSPWEAKLLKRPIERATPRNSAGFPADYEKE